MRQFQIVHEPARLQVRVVLDPDAPGDVAEHVRSAVTGALEDAGAVPRAVEVVVVDGLLQRESGAAAKLKLIVSRT